MNVKAKGKNLEDFKTSSQDLGAKVKENKSSFPDYGPTNIKKYDLFLQKAKDSFDIKWKTSVHCKEDMNSFEKIKVLGKGAFGYVSLVKHKPTEKYYAMKAQRISSLTKYKQMEEVLNEKQVLYCLDFPLTIYLKYLINGAENLSFVMPYIRGGDLFGHIEKLGKFSEAQAKFYASQVILALEYLHYLDLVYRDIKPENILVDDNGYIKMGDFGFCKRLSKNGRTYTVCGTPQYLAPEMIMGLGYGKAVDWWAMGVFIYELVAGTSPFESTNQTKMFEKIVSQNYKIPSHFSLDLRDLIKNILQADLTKRYGNLRNGSNDIKNHKWFKTINWLQVLNRRMPSPYIPAVKTITKQSIMKSLTTPKQLYENESEEFKHTDQFIGF